MGIDDNFSTVANREFQGRPAEFYVGTTVRAREKGQGPLPGPGLRGKAGRARNIFRPVCPAFLGRATARPGNISAGSAGIFSKVSVGGLAGRPAEYCVGTTARAQEKGQGPLPGPGSRGQAGRERNIFRPVCPAFGGRATSRSGRSSAGSAGECCYRRSPSEPRGNRPNYICTSPPRDPGSPPGSILVVGIDRLWAY